MSSSYLPSEELLRLLAALADEKLTEEQEGRLADLLRQNPQARAYYLDYVALLTSLQWEYAATAVSTALDDPKPAGPASPRGTRWLAAGAIGLAGLAAGLVLALTLLQPHPPEVNAPPAVRAEATDDSVAVLLQAPGAVWEEMDPSPRPGAALPVGRLHLKSGLAHVQFYSGATVILEGPADLQLISPMEAYCTHGKLRALVPPQAQGFTIGSPKLDLVDLGTEFGLRVDGGGRTEVHVFQGKVEMYDAGSLRAAASRKELTGGRGLRLDGPGPGTPIAPEPAAFRTAQQLAELANDETNRRHRRWLAASERLRRDPRLLVYYTFQAEAPWSRTLTDQVPGRQPPRNGVIVGGEWVPGRWPGKQALEFKRPGDRIRLNVPGEHASLTFMTWIRLDGLDREFTGLLLTDEFREGNMHWQITQDGRLYLSLKAKWDPVQIDALRSPPVLGPAHLGQWVHLASVYDSRARTITHYVNGRAVASMNLYYPSVPIKLGPVEIGNWGLPSRGNKVPIRNLNGRMDEFLLFNEALDAREIHDLHEAGKPNS